MTINKVRDAVAINIAPLKQERSHTSLKIEHMVNFLLMKQDHLFGALDSHLLKRVINTCEPKFLESFALSLQQALLRVDLKHLSLKDELFISQVISLIPYCYPKIGQVFQIPVKSKNGTYCLKTYTVERVIETSVSRHLSPLKAYFLTSPSYKPLLIFTGTTFPSGDGFLNSLIADFTPFSSVGKLPFIIAKPQLEDIFKDYSAVMVYGMSLGGALALHTLRDFQDKISEVFASVPAGLHSKDDFKSQGPKVVIITQKGDIVSDVGYFPEHERVSLYSVNLQGRPEKALNAHARVFCGSPRAKIDKIDPKIANRSQFRRILTAVHFAFSWLVFTFLALSAAIIISKNSLIQAMAR